MPVVRLPGASIFNTDQGSQFTGQDFTQTLKDAGVAISMDGKGRWMDNVFIEKLWRSVKWECIYLRELETGSQARVGGRAYNGMDRAEKSVTPFSFGKSTSANTTIVGRLQK